MTGEMYIFFKTEMVQGIIGGIKTMTRRLRGLEMFNDNPHRWVFARFRNGCAKFYNGDDFCDERFAKCPYGNVGDLLWVKETYTILEPEHCEAMRDRFYYKASHNESNEEWRLECIGDGYPYKWKPSIFMPKRAARIWLEITNVRVERLQDISVQDAIAEGIERHTPVPGDGPTLYKLYPKNGVTRCPIISFKSLWESISGSESWKESPWVWVIEFKVISKTGKP